MQRNFGKCRDLRNMKATLVEVCVLYGSKRESQEVLYVTQPQNAKTDIILPQFPFSEMPTPG